MQFLISSDGATFSNSWLAKNATKMYLQICHFEAQISKRKIIFLQFCGYGRSGIRNEFNGLVGSGIIYIKEKL